MNNVHATDAVPVNKFRDRPYDLIVVGAGAALLHGCAVLKPSLLPARIAALAENRLWFNRGPPIAGDNPFPH